MDNKNHVWYLNEVVHETKDTITIRFNTGGKPFRFLAGQFVNVALIIGGEAVTRSYSLSSSPNEQHPSITVKRVSEGVMGLTPVPVLTRNIPTESSCTAARFGALMPGSML